MILGGICFINIELFKKQQDIKALDACRKTTEKRYRFLG